MKGCEIKMTLKEAAVYLGKSEITLQTKFKRTQENLKKKGIILIKTGRGDKADYQIIYKKEIK
jgi:hypothetical protein